mgnify:CR=1 FL=1
MFDWICWKLKIGWKITYYLVDIDVVKTKWTNKKTKEERTIIRVLWF